MELNHRIYELNVQSNFDGQEKKIKVMRNGEDTGATLSHIFKNVWFETGKIIGYSILEYYSVEDGFLVDKEGNKIHFSSERNPEIKINRIKKPGLLIFGEEEVTKEWVRDTGKIMGLEKTEETVKGLSAEDKKALQDEREVEYAEIETKKREAEAAQALIDAEEARKLAEEEENKKNEALAKQAEKEAKEAEAAAEKARQEEEEARIQAEKSAEAARKADEERKAKEAEAEKEFLYTKLEYDRLIKKFVDKDIMKLYVKDKYHLFYGKNLPKKEVPLLFVKRENDYLLLASGIADEGDAEVELEFTDVDGKDKILIVDLVNEELSIN